MYYKRILIILLFTILCSRAFSAVFVVTSNADSGPGTLRDALTQAAANGTTEKDYINFNLPDVSVQGRTITLLSNLPAINSDMIIDGSTQPGTTLSANGAKVIIGGNYYDPNYYIDYFLIENVNFFEMDGLVIKSFFPEPYNNFKGAQAIIIAGHNKAINFGQPGKGNVIYDCSQAIECAVGESYYFPEKSSTTTFTLKANFIGLKEDGITIPEGIQSNIGLNYAANIILGGDAKAEGNVIYGLVALSPSSGTDNFNYNAAIKIKNNVFGANILQQRTNDPNINTDWNSFYLVIAVNPNNTYSNSSSIQVTDNVFGYALGVSGFQKLNLLIQHNFFGVSADLKNSLPIAASALTLNYMQGTILVGGDDINKGNYFTNSGQNPDDVNYAPGVISVSTFSPTLDPLFKVELSHNSFYCNNTPPFQYYIAPDKKPLAVTVNTLTATSIDGTTTQPNSRVELFYTDKECTQCQPKTYLATVNSDANGKWVYHGNLLAGYGVMAGATYNQVSSEFTDTRIYAPLESGGSPTITNAECTFGGSISGMYTVNAKAIAWLNSNNEVVGTDLNLVNVPPGKYRLKAEQFGCVIYSAWFEVLDYSPQIHDDFKQIINPSCGEGGSITGFYTGFTTKTEWLDGNGNVISDQLDINNLSAGSYLLRVTGQKGCVKTYGPVTLKNTTGPNIDQSKALVKSTNCGESTGSVTNIQVTGTGNISYSWTNDQQQQVATTKDLLNQPGGTYKLKVTDDTQCGPVYTSAITIPVNNGIVIDDSKVQITFSSCNSNNASITGIQVTGAARYVWTDANNNKVITIIPTYLNIAPGDYTLTASNEFGCSLTSNVYHVGMNTPTALPAYSSTIVSACFHSSDGSVTVATDGLVKSSRWVNSLGQSVGATNNLQGVSAGVYQLYLTDQNGCEQLYATYTVSELSAFAITNKGTATNDQCGLKTGSVTGIAVSGGEPPYTYKWLNSGGEQIASTSEVASLTAGTYMLTVADTRCGSVVVNYTIAEDDQSVNAPSVSNMQLCSSGNAVLTVNTVLPGIVYRLYDSPGAAQPIAEEASGRFNVPVTTDKSFFVSAVSGTCESARAEIDVSVGLSNSDIVNAFTPNGDGINEYWQIKNIENYPNATIQVFTRQGQRVFNSTGYSKPFNGKNLPAGVYYYIINLGSSCNILSGSLTIIR